MAAGSAAKRSERFASIASSVYGVVFPEAGQYARQQSDGAASAQTPLDAAGRSFTDAVGSVFPFCDSPVEEDAVSPGAPPRLTAQDLAALEATVQKATIKAAGCIALMALLTYLVVSLFLPIAKPLLAAVVVSICTHPSHTRERLEPFVQSYSSHHAALARYAPVHPLAAQPYKALVKVVLSLQVFALVPQFLSAMLGVSAAAHSAVTVLPVPASVRAQVAVPVRRACSIAVLAAFFCFFWGSIGLNVSIVGVLVIGVSAMIVLPVDRAAVAVLVVSGACVGGLLSLYVAGNVAVEALQMTDYAQDRVVAARLLMNETAEEYNVTAVALHYVVKGVEAAAGSQNVSLSELKDLLDTIKGSSVGTGVVTAASSVSTLGLGMNLWLDVSKHVGSTAVWLSNATVALLNVVLVALFALLDVFWAAVYFVFFLIAFNTTSHTLPFYVLRAVLSDPGQAQRLDQQVSIHLTSLFTGFLNLYVYHFALTFATMSRFGFEYPYTAATLAGFFALFPYVPKYFFLPLFLLPMAARVYDDAPQTLYELVLWMVVPFVLGDQWLFNDVRIAESRWMLLGAVLGWTNWGNAGVFLGPILVVLLGSVATIVGPAKQPGGGAAGRRAPPPPLRAAKRREKKLRQAKKQKEA
eukprot:TRINITY_DN14196_c0_g1_i2.p1 TRINITY_DN14196_c0_g1~~TRINITY_DN14196_c0_g1_i2.p1  ORF type:complete len:638 (+),score=221.76 TRINITY_DN14196_c0_g1_i2:63-1976(+)